MPDFSSSKRKDYFAQEILSSLPKKRRWRRKRRGRNTHEEPNCRLQPFSTETETLNSLCFRDWVRKQNLSSRRAPQIPLHFCSLLLLRPFLSEMEVLQGQRRCLHCLLCCAHLHLINIWEGNQFTFT